MKTKEVSLLIPSEIIQSKIYLIRGEKVMIDRDLSELYGVSISNLNKAVNRNLKRFPEDFMFQLNNEEFKNLIFQFGTSSWGGTRKLPSVFTEQGVAMLSGILNSDRAIMANIEIMRTFTKIRHLLTDNTDLRLAIEKLEKKTDNNTKNKQSFPTDEALMKSVFLAVKEATKKWTMQIKNWGQILNQFMIIFENRIFN